MAPVSRPDHTPDMADAMRDQKPENKLSLPANPQNEPDTLSQNWLDTKLRIHSRLIDEVDLATLDGLDTPTLKSKVNLVVREIAGQEKLKLNSREIDELASGIFDEMTGLGPLEPLLQDESVSDILINTHKQVYIERGGELELSPVKFANEEHLLRIINRNCRRRPACLHSEIFKKAAHSGQARCLWRDTR